ncbi:MAG: TIGR03086 family metal-binding protein [Acidimicrobiia bacterium]
MSTEALEQAFATTRGVLANVSPDQYDQPTPCESWDVRALVNHIVGGTHFYTASLTGTASADPSTDFAAGDVLAAYDQGTAAAVAAFAAPGAMERMVDLPFGTLPGAVFIGIASTDQFTHAWDLARATGQDTDLEPGFARQLLDRARATLPDEVRGPEGAALFGPKRDAAGDASNADQLAAFLGRRV